MPVSENGYIELTVQLDDSAGEELLQEINEYTERLRIEREAHGDDREWIRHLN
jgi:hypothetical protein